MRNARRFFTGLIAALVLVSPCGARRAASSPTNGPSVSSAPLTPDSYFQRAKEISDIRAPGSAPFQLKVHFVATGQAEITGEGDYEETWLAPGSWRRAITFGPYHAVEISNGSAQTLRATSDYIPKRVLQVMEALFPNSTMSEPKPGWKVAEGETPESVRLVQSRSNVSASVDFNPDGSRVCAHDGFITTTWSAYAGFSGKAVPRAIEVRSSMGPLLQLNVVELKALPASAELPADSGTDPVVPDVRGPWPGEDPVTVPESIYPVALKSSEKKGKKHQIGLVSVGCVIDTSGAPRDLEVDYATYAPLIPQALKAVSSYRFKPATRKGTPVEVFAMIQATAMAH